MRRFLHHSTAAELKINFHHVDLSPEAYEKMRSRQCALSNMTVAEYTRTNLDRVQKLVGRLGVRVSRGDRYFERFMAACLRAEYEFCTNFVARRKGMDIEHTHPDAIPGPWRRTEPAPASTPQPVSPTARTLSDCLKKWKANRKIALKPINQGLVDEMEHAFALFRTHQGIDDIGQIERKHVVAFRDHLAEGNDYAAATINKKVGFILNMSKVARHAAWIDKDLGGRLLPRNSVR